MLHEPEARTFLARIEEYVRENQGEWRPIWGKEPELYISLPQEIAPGARVRHLNAEPTLAHILTHEHAIRLVVMRDGNGYDFYDLHMKAPEKTVT